MEPFSPSTLLGNSFTLYPDLSGFKEKAKCDGKTWGKKVTQTFIALLDIGAQVTILPSPTGQVGIGHRVVKCTKDCRTLRRYNVSYMEGKKKNPESRCSPDIGKCTGKKLVPTMKPGTKKEKERLLACSPYPLFLPELPAREII